VPAPYEPDPVEIYGDDFWRILTKHAEHTTSSTMASTSIAAAAMSDDGTTEDLLLPGDMVLSKDAIVKALAKPAVWGVGDKKRVYKGLCLFPLL